MTKYSGNTKKIVLLRCPKGLVPCSTASLYASRDTNPVYLVGPTGVGKTSVALDLAEKIDAEIVVADSMQIYRGLDIGTAKPSLEEKRRVPHHMLDLVDPLTAVQAPDVASGESFSAAK